MVETIDAALLAAAQSLAPNSETPRLDAELLLAHALGVERGEMLLKRRDLSVPADFSPLIERRASGEPVAYIIGTQDFWDLSLEVSPAVLIPRGDSETLIDAALAHFAERTPPSRILDLGTGSGALLLAALSAFPESRGVGIDSSAEALAVAQGNADRLGFASRAKFDRLDWRHDTMNGQYDLILCNPPYVEDDAILNQSVRDFEPHSALFSGPNGMDDYQILIPQVPAMLTRDAAAIFEIGKGQEDAVGSLANEAGMKVDCRTDLAGIIRALTFTCGR